MVQRLGSKILKLENYKISYNYNHEGFYQTFI